jgi:hypothetical protein
LRLYLGGQQRFLGCFSFSYFNWKLEELSKQLQKKALLFQWVMMV